MLSETYLTEPSPPDSIEYPIEHFDWIRANRATEFPLFALMGPAGSGKTFNVRQALERSPNLGILAASTGIAAVNLGGAVTINSLLKFYNEESIQTSFEKGRLQRYLEKIRETYKLIIIDEAFMLNDRVVGTLCLALDEINREGEKMGIVLLGDPAQLPPIPYDQEFQGQKVMSAGKVKKQKEIPWMFNNGEVRSALRSPGHIIRLTEIKRQTDQVFIEGLNELRIGNGFKGAQLLQKAGVNFINDQIADFAGTTLIAVNTEVDRCNQTYLMRHDPNQTITKIPSYRWFGRQMVDPLAKSPADWNTIPEALDLKLGAYVMLLANSYDATGELIYANGDTGYVEGIEQVPRRHIRYKEMSDEDLQAAIDRGEISLSELSPKHSYATPFADLITHDWNILIRIIRKEYPEGKLITVAPLIRQLESKMDIEDQHKLHPRSPKDSNNKPCQVSRNEGDKIWVDGQIVYYPIRLAKFTTVFKAQGLTFDTVQVNLSHSFMKHPAMTYTAMSRCRTPEGLYVVGSLIDLAQKTVVDKSIKEWL